MDGLDVNLVFQTISNSTLHLPILNGVRITPADPPRVVDVKLSGSGWQDEELAYSFSEIVPQGMQLRPIPTQGVDTIEIHFDGPVDIAAEALTLMKSVQSTSSPNSAVIPTPISDVEPAYDAENFIATWTFTGLNALGDGKYAIHLDSNKVTGGGQALDADWVNEFGENAQGKPTADIWTDDPHRAFITSNGTSNGIEGNFRLNFALLAGDYDGNGIVNASDASPLGDGNGDGQVNSLDDAVRIANLNDFLPLRAIHGADLEDDESVDGADLAIWMTQFALGNAGDINGDGVTNGADFLLWQTLVGSKSAWAEPLQGGGGAALVGDFAPWVTDVIISGSLSLHDPYSFDGAGADGSGAQLATCRWAGRTRFRSCSART